MNSDSPESWRFTEGGVYVGGGSRGAAHHGSDHDAGEGEVTAVHREDPLNPHMDFFAHNSELHCMGVASKASPLGGDCPIDKNEVISVLNICLHRFTQLIVSIQKIRGEELCLG